MWLTFWGYRHKYVMASQLVETSIIYHALKLSYDILDPTQEYLKIHSLPNLKLFGPYFPSQLVTARKRTGTNLGRNV